VGLDEETPDNRLQGEKDKKYGIGHSATWVGKLMGLVLRNHELMSCLACQPSSIQAFQLFC
jgi:hypothetical protein